MLSDSSDAAISALRKQLQDQEQETARTRVEWETAERQLAQLRSETDAARSELQTARATLGGARAADKRAARLHLLRNEKEGLDLKLDNAHRQLAKLMSEKDEIYARFGNVLAATQGPNRATIRQSPH